MKKYVAALLVALGMLLVMAAPALAQEVGCVEEFPGGGSGACEQNPGTSEASRSQHQTPPTSKPGGVQRSSEANEHDTNTETGRGERIE
jgi:hypothetical protein